MTNLEKRQHFCISFNFWLWQNSLRPTVIIFLMFLPTILYINVFKLFNFGTVWYIFVIFIFSGKISMILVWQNSLRPTVIIFLHILIRAILPWLLQQMLTTFTIMFITELLPMLEHLPLRQVQVQIQKTIINWILNTWPRSYKEKVQKKRKYEKKDWDLNK